MQITMKQKQLPSKDFILARIKNLRLSEDAKNVIYCMVENAGFEYCIITKQLMEALGLSKTSVDSALAELIKIGIVKQQVLAVD